MKKFSKITRSLFTFILSALMFASTVPVHAAAETIQLGTASQTGSYIAGVSFSYKVTVDGKYLYCLDIHKNTAQNVQANLVHNSRYIDGGLVYILKNGFPNKNITGNKDKDYYITQTALWWYLDLTKGATNLGSQFKYDGSDVHNMRETVKKLAYDGYAHRNDPVGVSETKLVIGATGGNTMTLASNYYTSNPIKATTAKNISSYKVKLIGAPSGTKIVLSNGTESSAAETTVGVNDTFKVLVPYKSVSSTQLSFKVYAEATGTPQYMAYHYSPVNQKMQDVALLEMTSGNTSSELTLEIVTSKVSVVKVDTNTKNPIAGAELVLKGSDGKVISTWVSTTNYHVIRNLANGTYTITETKAPTGYRLNTNVTTFTITNEKREFKISIENAPIPKKSIVNISKVDQATKQPIAGAVLVVRNSAGAEVARFTSTTSPYVIEDLPHGTYSVEEISAPAGYKRNTYKLSFTIDDNHLSHQIEFDNAREVPVPDTASGPSIWMILIGIVITGLGLVFVQRNAQHA